jgi:hypothetical protein
MNVVNENMLFGLLDERMITINNSGNNSVVGMTSVSSGSTSATGTTTSSSTTTSTQSFKSHSIRIDVGTIESVARDIEDRYLFDTEQAKIRDYEMYRRIERGRRRAHRKKQQQQHHHPCAATAMTASQAATTCTNAVVVVAAATATAVGVMSTDQYPMNHQHHHHHHLGSNMQTSPLGVVVGQHPVHQFQPICHPRSIPIATGLKPLSNNPMMQVPLYGCGQEHQHPCHPSQFVPTLVQLLPMPVFPWFLVDTNGFGNQLALQQQQQQQYHQGGVVDKHSTLVESSTPHHSDYSNCEGIFQLDL